MCKHSETRALIRIGTEFPFRFRNEFLNIFFPDADIAEAWRRKTNCDAEGLSVLCWQFDSDLVCDSLNYFGCYLAGAPAQRRVGADRAVNDGLPVDVSAILLVEYWHANFSQNISDAFGV